jgi:hypothetical protein
MFHLYSDACCKCFTGCFKSRSCVAHVVMWLTCHYRLLQLLGHRACMQEAERWSAAGWWVQQAWGATWRSLPGVGMQQPRVSRRGLPSGHPDASTAVLTVEDAKFVSIHFSIHLFLTTCMVRSFFRAVFILHKPHSCPPCLMCHRLMDHTHTS